MKLTIAFVALAMSGAAAHAGSIEAVTDTDAAHPSVVHVGTADAPVKQNVEAKAETALPVLPQFDEQGNKLDGRSQLEAWARMNGTTVEALLTERLYGHYPKKAREAMAAKAAPVAEARKTVEAATDSQKTASVSADEPALAEADAGTAPMFPDGELRKPE